MVEPVTTTVAVASGVGAYMAGDGVTKLLGPTMEYLGGNLKEFVEKRHKNFDTIVGRAINLLGKDADTKGAVPPRVLKEIIEEGTYSEDQEVLEYYGGVLASSRSHDGRDDRGVRFAKIVSNLTSYQVRAHYILYKAANAVLANKVTSLAGPDTRQKCGVFIPIQQFGDAMGLAEDEMKDFGTYLSHALFGLYADGLVERFEFGNDLSSVGTHLPNEAGVYFIPSVVGAELFLWGMGQGRSGVDRLLSPELDASITGVDFGGEGALHCPP